ncbi:Vacuolar protein sorting-associated protein 4, partial [Coemansia sp. S17]
MRVHQQASQGNWAHPPAYSRPVAPPHVGQATSPKYTSKYPAAFPPVASTTRANGPSDRQAAPVRLAPILENRRANGGQAVDNLINDTLDQLDSSDAEYKAETSEETTAKAKDIVNRAIAEDNAGNYEEAYKLYRDAIEWYLTGIKYEKVDSRKLTIRKRLTEYMDRAEQLKEHLAKARDNRKPVPVGSTNGGG